MRSIPTRTLTTLTVTILCLWAAGCKDQVQLAAILPLTGTDSGEGQAVRKGLELALEEIQAQGDAPRIALEIVDSGSDPDRAQELLSERYDRGVLAVIGGVTAREAAAMVPVAEDAGRVLLSPSATVSSLSESSRQFYRLAPSDVVAGNTMADFAYRRLGVGTAVAYAEDALYAGGLERGFASSFEALGGELAAMLVGGSSVAEAMAEAAGHAADAVYLAGSEPTIAAAVRELRALGFDGRILTTQDLATSSAIAGLGPHAEDVLLTRAILEAEAGEHVAGFFEAYRQKYGEEPDIVAAEGYDALQVLALAIADRPALPSEVRKGLRDAVKSYAGVTGTLEFNSHGEVTKYPRVYGIAEDLSLVDHGKLLERKEEELRRLREQRLRELQEIRKKMAEMSSD